MSEKPFMPWAGASDFETKITLRDYFAGQAIAGLAMQREHTDGALASYAYNLADKMLKERDERELKECPPFTIPTSKRMKRYLLFFGHVYYPGGGATDIFGETDDLDAGIERLMKHIRDQTSDLDDLWRFNWAHVYDTEDFRVVWNNGKRE